MPPAVLLVPNIQSDRTVVVGYFAHRDAPKQFAASVLVRSVTHPITAANSYAMGATILRRTLATANTAVTAIAAAGWRAGARSPNATALMKRGGW